MLELLRTVLSSEDYIPHGHCYLWKPELVWLHVISNGAIAFAYFSIPILLLYFVSQRKDIPFNWVFLLFGAFIIACGSGHVIDIWTIWHPNYWISGILKAGTAVISLYTALELIALIPQALAIPSPAQLATANRELEQTLHQLQQTQSHLIQAEKMSSLGQLVAGVAHEINNPINFIYGNLIHAKQYILDVLYSLHLYQQACPEPPLSVQSELDNVELDFIEQDLPKVLESMQIGADRIRQIVLSLRNFSRLDESEMKQVNVHDGIDSALLILQSRLKGNREQPMIQVVQEYGELPLVNCYAGQLNQVFMNILSNAIDALEDKIQSDTTQSDASRSAIDDALDASSHLASSWVEPGGENTTGENANNTLSESHLGFYATQQHYAKQPTITIRTQCLVSEQVLIQISDNGAGIAPTIRNNIFNPFFTTKKVGKGTGLGLSISYQIVVERHCGELECDSELGQGTRFSIKIPVRQSDRVHAAV